MTLSVYNTLTQKKEAFTPSNPDHIKMYVCGPTVYNYIHIGNARPAVVFDTLYRVLQHHYPKVTYARNITDVDDKINKAAQEQNVDIRVISDKFAQAYRDDINQLNVLTPDIEPRATENIDQMIDMIERLIEKGFAYAAEGHVLFNVKAYEQYGELSKRSLDDMLAGARVEVAPYKQYAGDFVLWKPSSDEQPGWDSPWGNGRPGWHIECSAMIERHLGTTIDIHGGGQDLTFPHHENEIAQSTCAHDGETYVKYWMHNGYITIQNKESNSQEKMSKSLGNFITVRELLEEIPGEVVRFALLSAHYRSQLNWSIDLIEQAYTALDRLYTALRDIPASTSIESAELPQAFIDALNDDLNTPMAIAELHNLAKQINKTESAEEKSLVAAQLRKSASLLGLLSHDAENWFKSRGNQSEGGLSDDAIEALIQERIEAKKNKDFARSDQIRDDLKAQGIELEDTREGTRWQRA
ncbi:cysteine--tRNA ligase [Litoribacillus peritrichatus]|uniref:Cysteine--tRNA ligase n=1 Tax=Litoribacillus peritrichatus TaxID=718191 RepID=A0ABP7M0E4_9GAMM